MQSARSHLKLRWSFAAFCLVACQGETMPQPGESGRPKAQASEPESSAAGSRGPDGAAAPGEGAVDTPDTAAWLDQLVTPRRAGRYAPRDECDDAPEARQFRIKLAEAVRERDAEAVAALALPGVNLGFGGEGGRTNLRARLEAPGSDLFGELSQLLRLGCAVTPEGGMTMPWYFAQPGPADPYRAMLVTGVAVPLRSAPNEDADVERRISWDFVKLISPFDPDNQFQQVLTVDGEDGYVSRDDLRSLLDYRLLAVQTPQGWRISSIVAGD